MWARVALPPTVVIPCTVRLGEFSAIINARASSVPGSVSIRTLDVAWAPMARFRRLTASGGSETRPYVTVFV